MFYKSLEKIKMIIRRLSMLSIKQESENFPLKFLTFFVEIFWIPFGLNLI